MRVYVPRATHMSRAMTRVEDALVRYTKHAVTRLPSAANIVVIHAIGYPDVLEAVEECERLHQRFVLFQYCLRTTQEPKTTAWLELWRRALLVVSYYDLVALAAEDGETLNGVNFYHTPLGVDAEVFRSWESHRHRPYEILTSGYIAEQECAQEAASAAARIGGETFHLGPDLRLRGAVTYRLGITDEELAQAYRRCQFVAGLRRIEGFELPAAEGLLCGARPILFDQPHYRRWFEPWGEFIQELSPKGVEDQLALLFANRARPVEEHELRAAQDRFDWEKIVGGLWECVR